nr:hypothetical protein [Noviherbaspirillum malthae]
MDPVGGIVGDALEHLPQIGYRIKTVKFDYFHQAAHSRSPLITRISAGERIVFASKFHTAQCMPGRRVTMDNGATVAIAHQRPQRSSAYWNTTILSRMSLLALTSSRAAMSALCKDGEN